MLPGGPWLDYHDILRVQCQLSCVLAASRPKTLAIDHTARGLVLLPTCATKRRNVVARLHCARSE